MYLRPSLPEGVSSQTLSRDDKKTPLLSAEIVSWAVVIGNFRLSFLFLFF